MKTATVTLLLAVSLAAAVGQTGCAHLKPSRTEDDDLEEQRQIQKQEEFRATPGGQLLEDTARGITSGLKELNHQ